MGNIGGSNDIFDGLLTDVSSADIDLESPDVFFDPKKKNLFAEAEKSGSWDVSVEARCDFKRTVSITRRANVWFLSPWKKSIVGRTFRDIKGDDSMIGYFAENVSDLISEVYGTNLRQGAWCLCCAPKRRHQTRNFATLVCIEIAKRLDIPFYEDAGVITSKKRINEVFKLNNLPAEPNVIVFDDIVTTGMTLAGMDKMLRPLGKNLIYVAGINNEL